MLKKVLLLHTGGTFGMMLGESNEASRTLLPDALNQLFTYVPELKGLAALEMQILCNLDSSDMNPDVWHLLATTIVSAWDDFDGFVIIHGTDTMAYTSTALSFFLSGLTKPVVLTGSQRPLSELRNDARANIIDAVELATMGFPEVMVCFDSRVHRGTRVTKFSNEHMQAFRAHNSSCLGNFGVHFKLNRRLLAKPGIPSLSPRNKPILDTRVDPQIVCLDATPGLDLSETLSTALVSSAKGFVVRGYGAGNLPVNPTRGWLKLCEKALASQVPVVMTSQCFSGAVNLSAYENGRRFRDLGVISAFDMSFESVTVKLMVMLGREIPFERRQEFFATPLAFEVS